uniref:ZP domain-containing protein n=1 Tax=Strongyloides papillosus TaxID=174720 RepID=A0A0N5C5Y1_STREA
MVFLRVLTVFIVCISISGTYENEKGSTDVYARVWGYLDCKEWMGDDVLINLKKDGKTIERLHGNCKKNFYYNESTDYFPKFSADFAYYYERELTWKNGTEPECKKYPLKDFVFYDCRFGSVVLKNSEKKVIRKRRNREKRKRLF